MKWFVRPATVRLDLGDGEWIEVKEQLGYGETQQLQAAALGRMTTKALGSDQDGVELNWAEFNIRRLLLWLVDWSAKDERGRPVPITRDSIAALDPATVARIDEALTAHIEAMEKNGVTTGASVPETK